jgi:hypothetical protein
VTRWAPPMLERGAGSERPASVSARIRRGVFVCVCVSVRVLEQGRREVGGDSTAANEAASGASDGKAEVGAAEDGAGVRVTTVNPPTVGIEPLSIWLRRSAAAVAGNDTVTRTLPARTLTLTSETSTRYVAAMSLAMSRTCVRGSLRARARVHACVCARVRTAAASKSVTDPASVNVTVASATGAAVGSADDGAALLGAGVTGAGVRGAPVAGMGTCARARSRGHVCMSVRVCLCACMRVCVCWVLGVVGAGRTGTHRSHRRGRQRRRSRRHGHGNRSLARHLEQQRGNHVATSRIEWARTSGRRTPLGATHGGHSLVSWGLFLFSCWGKASSVHTGGGHTTGTDRTNGLVRAVYVCLFVCLGRPRHLHERQRRRG